EGVDRLDQHIYISSPASDTCNYGKKHQTPNFPVASFHAYKFDTKYARNRLENTRKIPGFDARINTGHSIFTGSLESSIPLPKLLYLEEKAAFFIWPVPLLGFFLRPG